MSVVGVAAEEGLCLSARMLARTWSGCTVAMVLTAWGLRRGASETSEDGMRTLDAIEGDAGWTVHQVAVDVRTDDWDFAEELSLRPDMFFRELTAGLAVASHQ